MMAMMRVQVSWKQAIQAIEEMIQTLPPEEASVADGTRLQEIGQTVVELANEGERE